MNRHVFHVTVAMGLAFFATTQAHSAILFTDDFDSLPPAGPDYTITNNFVTSEAHWRVGPGGGKPGNVDILNAGGFHASTIGLCDAGSCIDLDGTGSGDNPYLYTQDAFQLEAGVTYRLDATVRGNGRSDNIDQFTFGFANPGDQSTLMTPSRTNLGKTDGPMTLSLFFTPSVTTLAQLFFQNESLADNFGVILHNVTLSSVPLPAAAWLLLSGLAGVGMIARRRQIAPTSTPAAA